MKARLVAALVLMPAAILPLLAQVPLPRLLGSAAPAVDAIAAPELTLLHALSDDGRWLLFTSTSERLTAPDANTAADAFLFDRTSGTVTLVSRDATGSSGNGTSLAVGASADASRIVYVSRASNLASADTNDTWDVLVHEQATGQTRWASLREDGGSSSGSASDPLISADGRQVIFRSPAKDLAPGAVLSAFNLFRRNLETGQTECLTTSVPSGGQVLWRLSAFAATPEAEVLAFTANTVSGSPARSVVVWKDLVTGEAVDCSANLPAALVSAQPTTHSAPALSADGRFVAFRSEMPVGAATRYGLCLHDVERASTTLLTLRTNDVLRQTFPASAFHAAVSADGRYVAYSASLPLYNPSASVLTNGPSQVYLYDAENATTHLVSAGPDGVTPAEAEAADVRLTPDGRSVWFVSRAGNLVPGGTVGSHRLYAWDRDRGGLRVVADLGEANPGGRWVMSRNGLWAATLTVDDDGALTIFFPETPDTAAGSAHLPPVSGESATGRGWVGVQPTGVSADGRHVALTAFPPGPAGEGRHMQVYLHDTQTGERRLMSGDADGNLANGHSTMPSLTADGATLLFVSPATNLVSADRGTEVDVFVDTVATGERTRLRPVTLASGAHASPPCLISPDGRWAFLTFQETTKRVSRLAELADGSVAASFPGVAVGQPSFSRDGQRLAVSLGASTPSGTNPRIEVHDTGAWFASGGQPVTALWTSASPATEPVLSADGRRVAYFHIGARGTNAVVVMDWAGNEILFAQPLNRQWPASLGLSADGRRVVWASAGLEAGSPTQAWCAEIESGEVRLVSVAPDGVSPGNGNSKFTAISADGRYVAFASRADNLVPDDGNGAKDVFLRDLKTGQTLLLSRTGSGKAGAGWSFTPFFSADGRHVFFLSHAPNLVPGDFNQNADLFQVEIVSETGPLLLIQRELTTGRVRLLWNGSSDRRYVVESTDELGGAWTVLPGEFAGNATVDLEGAGPARRFFRMKQL
ncbi:MAG: PD40 domain-containing protein [Verrucomicrobiales bacterium]|nr:PD40 domain-containing protein [Verrucomicrobiales bacterium]